MVSTVTTGEDQRPLLRGLAVPTLFGVAWAVAGVTGLSTAAVAAAGAAVLWASGGLEASRAVVGLGAAVALWGTMLAAAARS
jgi:hypothetical protein